MHEDFKWALRARVEEQVREKKKGHRARNLLIAAEWQQGHCCREVTIKLPAGPSLPRMSGRALSVLRMADVIEMGKGVSAWVAAGSGDSGVLLS